MWAWASCLSDEHPDHRAISYAVVDFFHPSPMWAVFNIYYHWRKEKNSLLASHLQHSPSMCWMVQVHSCMFQCLCTAACLQHVQSHKKTLNGPLFPVRMSKTGGSQGSCSQLHLTDPTGMLSHKINLKYLLLCMEPLLETRKAFRSSSFARKWHFPTSELNSNPQLLLT